MLVEEIMNTNVVTCPENETIHFAIEIMKLNKVRHLPIVDEKEQLIGIVAERNIKDALPLSIDKQDSTSFFSMPIKNIMVTDVITAHRLDFVEDLAAILYERKIGCIPIVEDHKVIGLVTETDMLYTLVQLTGAHQPSSIIEVLVENKIGVLGDVAKIIGMENVNITSVLLYPNDNQSMKRLVFRIQTMDPTVVIQKLKEHGYNVPWPAVPGLST